jgi:DNA-binding Xre family transcriptional regulator
MKVMQNNFEALLNRKAQREKRSKVPILEVARATGLSRQTLAAFARGQLTLYPEHMLVKLCEYFSCEIGDLLEIRDYPDPQTAEPADNSK